MGDKPRYFHPETIYLISNRCIDSKHLLLPDSIEFVETLRGVLARAVRKHAVKVYGFVFMGNHFHLLISAPLGNLHAFMQDFEAWLVKKIHHYRGIKGTIFPERYSPVPLLDDAVALDKLIYTLANPVAAGLVETPEQYPGASSLDHHFSGEPVRGRWVDRGRFNRNRRRNKNYDEEQCATYHEFKLSPLPQMVDWSHDRRAQALKSKLDNRCASLRDTRHGKPYLGVAMLRAIDPFSRPETSKTSPCPVCLATDARQEDLYREQLGRAISAFKLAMRRTRSAGKTESIPYPPGTIPPNWRRCVSFKGEAPVQEHRSPTKDTLTTGPPPSMDVA